jgi:hypothetical protein
MLLFSGVFALSAQPTFDILARTLRIQSQYYTGTVFSIDVDGREYWITAAHIVTGAKGKPYGRVKEKNIELKILNPGGASLEWLPVKFSVMQPEQDVDVVVLVPPNIILDKVTTLSAPSTSVGLLFGGPCEFLGYALDGGWRAKMDTGGSFWMPFIKHCTVSGIDSDAHMWILDGINNHGFSGGLFFRHRR